MFLEVVPMIETQDQWMNALKADGLHGIHEDVVDDLVETIEALRKVAIATSELDEVAGLRGDNQLPHPEDDPGLWTARMQTAWDETSEALFALPAWLLEDGDASQD